MAQVTCLASRLLQGSCAGHAPQDRLW